VRPRWCGPAPHGPVECAAQIRAHGETVPAVAALDGETLVVELRQPLRAVAAGQAVVLYDGDAVLGSATISATG
jgi:tRNA-specific 2-thiouridylase